MLWATDDHQLKIHMFSTHVVGTGCEVEFPGKMLFEHSLSTKMYLNKAVHFYMCAYNAHVI